jgi:cytochrome c553
MATVRTQAKINQTALRVILACLLTIAPALGFAAIVKSRAATPQPDATLSATLRKMPSEARGKRIFEQNCAQCHQPDAQGWAEQKVPALAGQQYEYLAKQVVDFLSFERASDTMHKQLQRSGVNNATAIADVVAYASNLPMNSAPQKGDGQAVAQGKKVYASSCASCHGRTAEGNGDLWVPNLRGQHYTYLREQLQRMAQAKRNNVSEDLHRMFTTYSNQEFDAVADYLTRWNEQN